MNRRSALLPILFLGATGIAGITGIACGGKQEPMPSMPDQAAQAPAPAASGASPEAAPSAPATAPDSGVGPISSRATTPDASASSAPSPSNAPPEGPGAGAVSQAKLLFDLPKSWKAETPSSNLRLAQASIPGAAGPGELGVFHFGSGQGGSTDANLQRWTDQMEAGAGTAKPERGTLESNGLKVTWIDVHGTLKPSTMGMGPASPVTDARLFGAVVEGPGGPWFFKATGPDKTLGPQRDAFLALLKSARVAPNA
jgi:hypothetical protein